jgi:hypothetical protein
VLLHDDIIPPLGSTNRGTPLAGRVAPRRSDEERPISLKSNAVKNDPTRRRSTDAHGAHHRHDETNP